MSNGKRDAAELKLDDYPDEYLGCRLRRHQWDDQGIFLAREGRARYIVFRFRCMSCSCERTDVYDRSGDLVDRQYKHAKGYLIHYSLDERNDGVRVTTRTVAAKLVKRALREGVPELQE